MIRFPYIPIFSDQITQTLRKVAKSLIYPNGKGAATVKLLSPIVKQSNKNKQAPSR